MSQVAHDLSNLMAEDLNLVEKDPVTGVKSFDPATILAIFNIVMMIVKWLKERANSPEEVANLAGDLNFVQKALLRIKLRKYITRKMSTSEVLTVALARINNLEAQKLKTLVEEAK